MVSKLDLTLNVDCCLIFFVVPVRLVTKRMRKTCMQTNKTEQIKDTPMMMIGIKSKPPPFELVSLIVVVGYMDNYKIGFRYNYNERFNMFENNDHVKTKLEHITFKPD
ncbi:hypothetical protein DERF_008775 [Dermatophagoides farinae]|uniref:Uncharacterized protein n=1 Tax=Dermatophagoides farinae TaxID=6954 RepID=A0A922I6G0_DERFA|nr:hypothetical protein DERF_008775 [Dermatophagoides farinae]